MSKGFWVNFTDKKIALPQRILLDTSVLLHVVRTPPPFHASSQEKRIFSDTKAFLSRLEEAVQLRTTDVYIPLQAITEAFHYIMQTTIRSGLPKGIDTLAELKIRPQLIKEWNVGDEIANFLDELDRLSFSIVQPKDLYNSINPPSGKFENYMLYFIENAWLLSADAHIVTAAEWLDIKSIASVDRDFLRIVEDGFDLYTTPALPRK